MKANPNNIFQPYLVDGAAISERLFDLVNYYGADAIEAELIFEAGANKQIRNHIENLIMTYSFTEVLNWFECITDKKEKKKITVKKTKKVK